MLVSWPVREPQKHRGRGLPPQREWSLTARGWKSEVEVSAGRGLAGTGFALAGGGVWVHRRRRETPTRCAGSWGGPAPVRGRHPPDLSLPSAAALGVSVSQELGPRIHSPGQKKKGRGPALCFMGTMGLGCGGNVAAKWAPCSRGRPAVGARPPAPSKRPSLAPLPQHAALCLWN